MRELSSWSGRKWVSYMTGIGAVRPWYEYLHWKGVTASVNLTYRRGNTLDKGVWLLGCFALVLCGLFGLDTLALEVLV